MRAHIKTVTVRSSIQLANFQHIHIEATADVPPKRRAEDVLDELKAFVAKELLRAKEGEKPKPQPRPAGRFRDLLENRR